MEILVKMAGHTMETASIDYNDTEAALNTTGPGRNEVRIVETPVAESPKVLQIAPISTNIYQFEKQ
jgi:hypothetical protein